MAKQKLIVVRTHLTTVIIKDEKVSAKRERGTVFAYDGEDDVNAEVIEKGLQRKVLAKWTPELEAKLNETASDARLKQARGATASPEAVELEGRLNAALDDLETANAAVEALQGAAAIVDGVAALDETAKADDLKKAVAALKEQAVKAVPPAKGE